jgi:hypothetical protein
MSVLEEKLKMIREGAEVNEEVMNEADEEFETIMAEAAMDILMAESEMVEMSLEEAVFAEVTLSDLMIEAAAIVSTKDQKKAKSFFAKVKDKLKAIAAAFDPYNGLRELKLINELVKDDMSMNMAQSFGIIGLVIMLFSRAGKYKRFPQKLAKSYITEAKAFQAKLDKNAAYHDARSDKKHAKKARKMSKRLAKFIIQFERLAVDKSAM